MEGLTYKYYKKNNSKNIYLIIHGGGPVGVETDFISAIFDTIAKTHNSALCFNFPYCERMEESSSGPDLLEEISTLKQVIDFVHTEGYNRITIIAKSLGGIISSYYFCKISRQIHKSHYLRLYSKRSKAKRNFRQFKTGYTG